MYLYWYFHCQASVRTSQLIPPISPVSNTNTNTNTLHQYDPLTSLFVMRDGGTRMSDLDKSSSLYLRNTAWIVGWWRSMSGSASYGRSSRQKNPPRRLSIHFGPKLAIRLLTLTLNTLCHIFIGWILMNIHWNHLKLSFFDRPTLSEITTYWSTKIE